VNNAVGALNHKFFCLFLFYTAAACLVSFLLLLIRVVHCGYWPHNNDDNGAEKIREVIHHTDETTTTTNQQDNNNNNHNINHNRFRNFLVRQLLDQQQQPECRHFFDNRLVLALFVVSIVFFVFTCSMGCEQLEAIESGQGKIARMKMRVGAAGTTEYATVTTEFNEMFGGTTAAATWHWFVPVPAHFSGSMRTVILGYEWEETWPAVAYQEDNDDDDDDDDANHGSSSNTVTNGSGDVEMKELENGRLKTTIGKKGVGPSSVIENGGKQHVSRGGGGGLLTRQSSDASITESLSSTTAMTTRNRRLNSRSSDDAIGPRIV
jgi:hypothetical protein